MKTLALALMNIDGIEGVTSQERAKLVLLTLGRVSDDIRKAYRKLAKRCHPDRAGGDTGAFQVINGVYAFITEGTIPKSPSLADDDLIVRVADKSVESLIDRRMATLYEPSSQVTSYLQCHVNVESI